MTKSILIANAITMFHVTNLNTYVLNEQNEFLFHHEMVKIPSFLQTVFEMELMYFSQQINSKEKKVYSYMTQGGLHFLGYPFETEKNHHIIIGPYLTTTPNYRLLNRTYQLNNEQSEMTKDYYSSLQLLTEDKAEGFISILNQFDHMLTTKSERAIVTRDTDIDLLTQEGSAFEENNRDRDIVELRYKVENRIMQAVSSGNKIEAKNTFVANSSLFTFSERFPHQPMTRVKNLTIILNTLLRNAARKGNVPSYLLHRLSEKYAYKITYSDRMDQLQKLFTDMIESYSDLVLHHSIQDCSKSTQMVIEYLVSNYDKTLNKEYLSSVTFTHPGHLSRIFKKDTGKTIIGYQQFLRIDKAKYFLDNDNLPIEEVAWLVGYEDSSYFSRVFKKEVGCTPTEFRIQTEKTNSK